MIVSKWGNSLAVRLPKQLIKDLKLSEGDDLAIVKATSGQLHVMNQDHKAKFLAEMAKFHWPVDSHWKFDRDEANAR